jgi:hypothetical protein
MRWAYRLVLAGLLTSALSLTACKQQVGDRCQVQSDCEDGLLCVLPAGGTPQSGGTCQTTSSLLPDMTVDVDMTAVPDMTVAEDLTGTD